MTNEKLQVEKLYRSQIEKYENDIEKAKAKKKALQRKMNEEKRKLRTRKLIEIGGLADIANLVDLDKGAVLGILLQGSRLIEDEQTFENLKKLGDATLQERASSRKNGSKAQKKEVEAK